MAAIAPLPDIESLDISLVLDRPELSGGVKVALQLAELARTMGHRVRVFGLGPLETWASHLYRGPYHDRNHYPGPFTTDLVIATYYTTLPFASQFQSMRHLHFSQGYEGSFPHLQQEEEAIRRAYKQPWPVLTVNPHLGRWLAREFSKKWYFVPPPQDPLFRPRFRLAPHRKARIAIPGNFEVSWKGVRTCLDAIDQIESLGIRCDVVRLSLVPLPVEETSLYGNPQKRLIAASPEAVARTLRHCDLLLQGSTWEEGFGLPALEAALSGVPVVCTDLPAMRMIGIPANCRVPVGDSVEMAKKASRLITDHQLWRDERQKLLRTSTARFSTSTAQRRLQRVLVNLVRNEQQ